MINEPLKYTPQNIYQSRIYNPNFRYFATVIFMIQNIIYVGMVIYMPALALETVTSLSKWAAVWLTAGVCIFYTALGRVLNKRIVG